MKTMKKHIIYSLTGLTVILVLLFGCDDSNDYSDNTFRNYLAFEISRAEQFLEDKGEGTAEGEYKFGSKDSYRQVINESKNILDNPGTDQKQIDLAYSKLLQASEDFFDQMNPFVSQFQHLIDYADFTRNYTEEGNDEGMVKPGSREVLQTAINRAKSVLSDPSLVQRMIDAETPLLLSAIYQFDNNINGKGHVYVVNSGFEEPGNTTVNFDEVTGWKLFGTLETWAPKAEIHQGGSALVPLDIVPEGEFVLKIGSYTQGVYQQLAERIHPDVNYTIGMKVALVQNNPDAFGKRHKALIRTRIVTFTEEPGNYKSVNIVGEFYDTLGVSVAPFKTIQHTFNSGSSSGFTGSKMALDIMVRHNFDPSNPVWAECYVATDSLYMYRK